MSININFANAPCSWGVIEQTEGASVTYSEVLDEMSDSGFAGTELGNWGFMPSDPVKLREELDSRGLALVGSWATVRPESEEHSQSDMVNVLRTAKLIRDASENGSDNPVIVLGGWRTKQRVKQAGRITHKYALSFEDWTVYAENVTAIAKAVWNETGLRCVYHPHGGTWVETPGETATLMNLTDPRLVGLCIDTGHTHFGGGNAARAIEFYGDRVWHIHLKDFDKRAAKRMLAQNWDYERAVDEQVFCELGTGDVDFKEVLQALQRVGYQGWAVVEQDIKPGAIGAKENAIRNMRYISNLVGR